MSRQPSDRPSNALAFKQALERSLSGAETKLNDLKPPLPGPERRSGRGKIAVVTLCGLLLVIGVIFGLSRWKDQDTKPTAETEPDPVSDVDAERLAAEDAMRKRLEAEEEQARLAAEEERRKRLEEEAEQSRVVESESELLAQLEAQLQEFKLIQLPGGTFPMGSPDTEPDRDNDEWHHTVTVKPFAIGQYEVTFEQYDTFAQATNTALPDDEGWGRGKRPVVNVNWPEALAYVAWLAEQTGRAFRLPTEAEWEYASRAGTDTPFYTGQKITSDQANFDGSYTYNGSDLGEYREQTLPVGSLAANPFGLFDVHGNVREWTCSHYIAEYNGSELICEEGQYGRRSLRGGSWSDVPVWLRSANRTRGEPAYRYNDVGFRLAEDVD